MERGAIIVKNTQFEGLSGRGGLQVECGVSLIRSQSGRRKAETKRRGGRKPRHAKDGGGAEVAPSWRPNGGIIRVPARKAVHDKAEGELKEPRNCPV